jgi:hypothetical protein
MTRKFWVLSFWLGVGTLCLILGQGLWGQSTNITPPGANTGCGYSLGRPIVPLRPQAKPSQTETEFRSPRLLLVSDHHSENETGSASIVGFWKFQFLLPDGSLFDDGYVQWHSDGTEITWYEARLAFSAQPVEVTVRRRQEDALQNFSKSVMLASITPAV